MDPHAIVFLDLSSIPENCTKEELHVFMYEQYIKTLTSEEDIAIVREMMEETKP
jgi:hypothetical protein